MGTFITEPISSKPILEGETELAEGEPEPTEEVNSTPETEQAGATRSNYPSSQEASKEE